MLYATRLHALQLKKWMLYVGMCANNGGYMWACAQIMDVICGHVHK